VPPSPATSSGGYGSIRLTPTSSSSPGWTVGWTTTPSPVVPALDRAAKASRTSASPDSPSRTPPTSVLCTDRPPSFTATEYPIRAAAVTASSAV